MSPAPSTATGELRRPACSLCAARHDDPEDAKYRMVHIELGRKIADRSYGSEYTVKSWRWIDRDDFDRIVGMNEIRASFGWRAA
ncbi:hypothetical protein SEA_HERMIONEGRANGE_87 [Mycobacterium phage HermioneGrange]|nr:hypothetical protein SEA_HERMIONEGRANGE_87 [Mycobacterium phage HermioneGrange]